MAVLHSPIDWLSKAQHLLQTVAFSIGVATLQWAFTPERPYGPPLVYSLWIGFVIWAVIDLGRHLFPSSADTGWPRGMSAVLLVAGGIGAGYLLGNTLGARTCAALGWAVDHSAPLHWRTSILITLVAGGVGTFYFYARSRSAWLEDKRAEAERLAGEARLKLLETQLEPHMLFNTLANLRALIGVDPARAQTMLDHMIAYLRATLGGSRAATHPLQAEFDRLHDYLALMQIRMGPRLQYTLELAPDAAACEVPALLLQPLVENSLKHGLEPQVQGGRVEVRARRDGGRLRIEVADTGVGPQAPASPHAAPGAGFGLAQVRERLARLYGDAATFDFGPATPQGARAVLTLPAA